MDGMLGWLVRWLRMMGIDAHFYAGPDDAAVELDCLLVTRDKALFARRRKPTLLLLSDRKAEWLAAVAKALGIELGMGSAGPTRCPLCGSVLQPLPSHRPTWRCPGCGQLYWVGSHHRGIMAMFAEASRTDVECARAKSLT